jgi:hypothetical protein
MKWIFIFLVFLYSCDQKSSKKIRPYLNQILGENLTNNLLGTPIKKVEKEIVLPTIPKLSDDTKKFVKFKGGDQGKTGVLSNKKMDRLYLHFIDEIYREVLNVSPDKGQKQKWMNVLRQGGAREGIYRALVLDKEYKKLEQKNILLTDLII